MLTESLIIGILILTLRGKLGHYVEQVQFKGLWLPVAAFLIEWAAGFFLARVAYIGSYTCFIELLVYGALLAFVGLNRQHLGFKIAMLGLLLNAAVVLANGGYMPVEGETLRHFGFFETYDTLKQMKVFGHSLITAQTQLSFLGDVIHIRPPYPMPKSVSLGDVVLGLGIGLHLALFRSPSDMKLKGGRP